jgi:hypothetical protein
VGAAVTASRGAGPAPAHVPAAPVRVRGLQWAGGCRCGWRGPARWTRRAAAAAAVERHRLSARACARCGRERPWELLRPLLHAGAAREVLVCDPQTQTCRRLAAELDRQEERAHQRAMRELAARVQEIIDGELVCDGHIDPRTGARMIDVIGAAGAWQVRAEPRP